MSDHFNVSTLFPGGDKPKASPSWVLVMPGDFQTDYFPCFATSVTAVTEEARNSWVRHCLPVEAHVRGAFKGVPRALLGSAVREGEGVCSQPALCFVIREFLFCTILLCKVHLVHLCSVFDELLSGVQSRKLALSQEDVQAALCSQQTWKMTWLCLLGVEDEFRIVWERKRTRARARERNVILGYTSLLDGRVEWLASLLTETLERHQDQASRLWGCT